MNNLDRGGEPLIAFFKEVINSESVQYAFTTLVRLLLAAILGGFIGNEREHSNRPAGLRTHALVCIGSALVMVTSEFIFMKYQGQTNLDPARLGAQVISGIGFLGAGTIIKEGFSVKGLTTAASLWAVSCIGIALGIGFYSGAIIATILIFSILQALKKAIIKHSDTKIVSILVTSVDKVIYNALLEFKRLKLNVYTSEVIIDEDGKNIELRLYVCVPKDLELFNYARTRLRMIDGVISEHVE